MRGAAPFLLVSILVLSGCAAPGGTLAKQGAGAGGVVEKLLDLAKVVEASIPLKDGLKLHGTVYLPSVPEGTKVPVIMDLGPYYGDLGAETNVYSKEHPPNLLYEHFLRRGFAIALVSVRGTGQSEGCFQVGGPQERADAAAAVEWLAAQAWSNGNVGMTGVSYDGTTPWEALAAQAPHLKTIVPVEGISDMYRYTFFEGVPVGSGPLFQTYYEAMVDWAYLNPSGAPAWLQAQPTNVCPDQVDVFVNPYATYMDGAHNAYWKARDASAMLSNSTVPVFMVHGFVDYNVKMDNVQSMWNVLHGPKKMLLGQWEHNIPWRNSFNPDWSYAAYNQTMDQWFDAWLKDDASARDALNATPAVRAQDSRGAWHNLTAWPPAEAVDTPFFLTPKREMAMSRPNETGDIKYRTPGPVSDIVSMTPIPLPDGVTFRGKSLDKPLLLMGNPTLNITLSVDRPHGYIGAAIYDVDSSGAAVRVQPGYLNLAEREGRDSAKDVPAGQLLHVTVKFYALSHVFEAGHHLELRVSGATEGTPSGPPDAPETTLHIAPDAPAIFWAPIMPEA